MAFLYTGKFRGAAHNACNLLLKIDPRQHVTPVVFHNLRGYDSHFLIANLGKSALQTRLRRPQRTDADKGRGRCLSHRQQHGTFHVVHLEPFPIH